MDRRRRRGRRRLAHDAMASTSWRDLVRRDDRIPLAEASPTKHVHSRAADLLGDDAVLNISQRVGFVATIKPEEARRFYGEALGLPLIEDGPYALVFSANG